MSLETVDIARKIVDAALERHASDIVLMDLREVCSFTDYFVICSGESERQLRAICDEIDATLAEDKISPRIHQGSVDSGWLIMDMGTIVVHVFGPEQRQYYSLEEMWGNGSIVLRIQ